MASGIGNIETKARPSPAKNASKKVVKKQFALNSPFADPALPDVNEEDGSVIIDLLCRLLEPIGTHRAAWEQPSKGKRSRKRKRNEQAIAGQDLDKSRSKYLPPPNQPLPPEISQHIVVGFNGVVRCLDPLARSCIGNGNRPTYETETTKLVVIFVDQSTAPEILWSQLPFLATAAEMRDPAHQVWIVPLLRGSAVRLAETLHIPRAGIVGVSQDAPNAASLLSFVRDNVPRISIPWLNSGDSPQFRPTSVGIQSGSKTRQKEDG